MLAAPVMYRASGPGKASLLIRYATARPRLQLCIAVSASECVYASNINGRNQVYVMHLRGKCLDTPALCLRFVFCCFPHQPMRVH